MTETRPRPPPFAHLLRWLPVLGAVVLTLAIAVVVALLIYRQETREQDERLALFTRMKADQLSLWLRERAADGQFLESSRFLGKAYRQWRSGDAAAGDALRQRLDEFRTLNRYAEVLVVDRDGSLAMRLGDESLPLDTGRLREAWTDARGRHAYIDDFAPASDAAAGIDLVLWLPVESGPAPMVVLRVDPTRHLSAMLEDHGPAEADAILVRHDAHGLRRVTAPQGGSPATAALRLVSDFGEAEDTVDLAGHGGPALVGRLAMLPSDDLRLVSLADAATFHEDATMQAVWGGATTAVALLALLAGAALLRQGQQLRLEADRNREHARRIEALTLLAAIADALPDPVFAKDRDGKYLLFNREAARLAGKPADEILERGDANIFPPQQVAVIRESDERAMAEESNSTYEEALPTVDGERVYLTTKGPLRDAHGRVFGVFGVSRDITERRREEDERRAVAARLRESEERYRSIFSAISEGVVVFDTRARVLACNGAAESILHVSFEQMRDKEGLSGWRPVRRDGTPYQPEELPLARVIATGHAQHGVLLGDVAPGGEVAWLLVNAEPVLDAAGRVDSVVVSFTDITTRIDAERRLERYGEELERLVEERTSQLGRTIAKLESFSYTVSHDLRAPLRAIHGFAHMLKEGANGSMGAEDRRLLDRVIAAAENMNELLEDIQAYSRADRTEPVMGEVDMAALARAVVDELRVEYPGTRFTVGSLPRIHADATMMRQVLANLLGNGAKFSSKVAQPHVELGTEGTGDEVTFFVRDNGVGFDMGYAHQLFGLFQRLHRSTDYPGTGLGLAIVKQLVEHHGGYVTAESREGVSTTFRFTLAAAVASTAPAGTASA